MSRCGHSLLSLVFKHRSTVPLTDKENENQADGDEMLILPDSDNRTGRDRAENAISGWNARDCVAGKWHA